MKRFPDRVIEFNRLVESRGEFPDICKLPA
jgi:hypothetical protein